MSTIPYVTQLQTLFVTFISNWHKYSLIQVYKTNRKSIFLFDAVFYSLAVTFLTVTNLDINCIISKASKVNYTADNDIN